MTKIPIRGISLNVEIIGHGEPIVLMHGGPGADLYTMLSFKPLGDQYTLVFYDHRCNGRSTGADVTTMTMENLTADADALRQALGYQKWVVLGHSFGGFVALEYALRYPQNLTHLVLVDTGGDNKWALENVARELSQRGFDQKTATLAQRFLSGQIEPNEMFPSLMKLGSVYNPYFKLSHIPHMIGGLRTKLRPEALIFATGNYLKNWRVMDRLSEIKTPTLVLAGRDDFIFPPKHQEMLAAGIPNSRLVIIDRAGHNVHDEQSEKTIEVVRDFLHTAS